MASRLDVDRYGRAIVVITSPTIIELPTGMTFRLLGNDLPCNAVGFSWLGRSTGRPPLPAERLSGAYCARSSRRDPKPEPDDDLLDDEQAIEFARREQQHAPADLLSAVLSR